MEQFVSTRVRVGGFQLNLEIGELCPIARPEAVVLLREQPFQILKMLIDRRGKIVTREEIRKRLWPNDTVVNFDQGINASIRILRRELGDSADTPQYIETVARRGYRLLVGIESLPSGARFSQTLNNPPEQRKNGPESILGKKVSHYRVLEVIGGGGMGMVYKAEDLRLGRRVALKFLPEELADDPIALRRFEREAQTASALNHPNICTIYETEEYEGKPFIVMELLDGESLHHRLDAIPSRILPLPELIDLALQICDGLQAAHEKGIIHRDIKPANIFLTTAGQAKILDFGLAKLIEPQEPNQAESAETIHTLVSAESNGNLLSRGIEPALTVTGHTMGTTGYMSPEQVRREKLDHTSDLFSFGLVLYEAVTGSRAFAGDSAEAIHNAVLTKSPTPIHTLNSKTPRHLCAVIAKAIQKSRGERYQSALEMRRAVERARREAESAQRRSAWLAVSAALIVAVVLGIWARRHIEHRVVLSPGDSVVLAVTNNTQDLVFDEAIYSGLYWDLRQTPFFHVLDLGQVRAALAALHVPPASKNTPQISRQVCMETHSRLVIAARISQKGNGFHIDEEGIDCRTGNIAAETEVEATNRSDVIHALGLATTAMRATLGEPKLSLAKYSVPLELAMSSSPEAIQLSTDGYIKMAAADFRGAILDFQRALDLDPSFVMALAAIGAANNDLKRTSESSAEISKAFQLRARATIPVRLHVEDLYYYIVTGELEKDETILLQWIQDFPDDPIAHVNLGRCAFFLGQQDRSLAEGREAARLLPSSITYDSLLYHEISTNRFDEAHATLKEAESRGFDNDDILEARIRLAFFESNQAELRRLWQRAENKPGADYKLLIDRAFVEGYYGHERASRNYAVEAESLARKEGDLDSVVIYLIDIALQEAELGNKSQARNILGQSYSMQQQRFTLVSLALASARDGNIAEAQSLVDNIAHDFPRDTLIQHYSLPTIRAAIDLQHQNAARAVEELRNAAQYDLASQRGFADMYSSYIRGLAFLQLKQGQQAEAEFQKLIDHSGMVQWNVIGALARLQKARAQTMAGNELEAKASYEAFLDLWKNADPDLPVYQQAKAEYSELVRKSNYPFRASNKD